MYKKYFTCFFALVLLLTLTKTVLVASSPRTVIIEEATNASCGPCAAQNPIFEEFLDQFKFSQVIPLIYHPWWPGPNDPIWLNDTIMHRARTVYYHIDTTGVPCCRVNGSSDVPSSGWYYGGPGDTTCLRGSVEKYLATTSPLNLTVTSVRKGANVTVSVKVSSDVAITNVFLRVAAVEGIHYYANAGSNGEKYFRYLARKMLPDFNGTALTLAAKEEKIFTFNYSIPNEWYPEVMYAVAFVQDDATQEVLQASASLDRDKLQFAFASVPDFTGKYLKVPNNGTAKKNITIENINNFKCDFDLTIDAANSVLTDGWSAKVIPNTVSLDANSSTEVAVELTAGTVPILAKATIVSTAKSQFINFSDSKTLCGLSDGLKAVHLCPTKSSDTLIFNALNAQLPAMKKPFMFEFNSSVGEDLLDMFSTFNFDVIILSATYPYCGMLGAKPPVSSYSEKLYNFIQSQFDAGKKIILLFDYDLTISNSTSGSGAARQFYGTNLGLKANGPTLARYRLINKVVTPQKFTVSSLPVNEIYLKDLSFNLNNYSTQNPYFEYFTDPLALEMGSTATPFLYYDVNTSNIAATYYTNAKGGKMVYQSFGMEALGSNLDREIYINRLLTWMGLTKLKSVDDLPVPSSGLYVRISPNPASEIISVQCFLNGTETEYSSISIYDIFGNRVLQTQNTKLIDVGSLSSGVYIGMVNIGAEIRKFTFNIVK
ncbi:MAG: Omp28-related outer membrane protein [Candidatus Kapabacteria bacterium]|nr:Omp28-related outer membrane protein [Candidatus Kapabacteria bacterium]